MLVQRHDIRDIGETRRNGPREELLAARRPDEDSIGRTQGDERTVGAGSDSGGAGERERRLDGLGCELKVRPVTYYDATWEFERDPPSRKCREASDL